MELEIWDACWFNQVLGFSVHLASGIGASVMKEAPVFFVASSGQELGCRLLISEEVGFIM
jgi:hypothetical protein